MKRYLLLSVLFFLLWVPGSFASVARTGTCTASTTACTFTATATGDLKIVLAYRSGSATAPSLPTGWTQINTGSQSGGSASSFRIGCNVSSSSADTGSGTWTNAGVLVGVSYSGTNVGTTANCNTTGAIQNAGGVEGSGVTSASYNGFASALANSSSWVAGFMAASLTTCAPPSLTSRVTVGAGPAGRLSDAGPISTWAIDTCSVASESVTVVTVEIAAAKVALPSISPASGNYNTSQTVSITDATSSATICYTTDGTTPTATTPGTCSNGTTYTSSFSQNSNVYIEAIGTKSGLANSSVATNELTFGIPNVETANVTGTTITSGAINTTNAVLIVVACGSVQLSAGAPTYSQSDSAANTGWNSITQAARGNGSSFVYTQVFYKFNPTTSATHTFTCSTGATSFSNAVSAIAFVTPYYSSGMSFDKSCSLSSALGTTWTSLAVCDSALTPTVANEILIVISRNGGGTITGIDSGFFLVDGAVSTVDIGLQIDPNTSAINPNLLQPLSTTDDFAPVMVAFNTGGAAAGGGGGKRKKLEGFDSAHLFPVPDLQRMSLVPAGSLSP